MRLYFAPGACSLAPHIAAHEAGIDLALTRVDVRSKTTADGADFRTVNPKGYVPALELDGGQVLTEVAAILQYLADRKPDSGLLPAAGSLERYRALEWLNFVATEIHKGFGPLWNPATPEAAKTIALERLSLRFAYLDAHLQDRAYLLGDAFAAPDAYAFTVLSWAGHLKIDLSAYPAIGTYLARVAARPGVRAALMAEGLLKETVDA